MRKSLRQRKILAVGCANWQSGPRVLRYFHNAGFDVHVFATPTDTLVRSRYARRRIIAEFPLDDFTEALRDYTASREGEFEYIILCDEVIINHLVTFAGEPWVRELFRIDHERVNAGIYASKIVAAGYLDRWCLPQPKWRALRGAEDLESAALDPGFPLFLKPEDSFGGQGAGRVDSAEDLKRFWSNRPEPGDYIAQAFIQGQVGSLAAFCHEGNTMAAFYSTKAVTFPEPNGASCVREFAEYSWMSDFVRRFGEETGYSGVLGMDIIVCGATERPYIIETNIRPTPQMGFAHLMGVDVAAALASQPSDSEPQAIRSAPAVNSKRRRIRMFPPDFVRSIHQDPWWRILSSPLCADYWRTAPLDDPAVLYRQLRSLARPLWERATR